jgi:hypothetical protein
MSLEIGIAYLSLGTEDPLRDISASAEAPFSARAPFEAGGAGQLHVRVAGPISLSRYIGATRKARVKSA